MAHTFLILILLNPFSILCYMYNNENSSFLQYFLFILYLNFS